jgi:hypothetical protein
VTAAGLLWTLAAVRGICARRAALSDPFQSALPLRAASPSDSLARQVRS